MTKKTEKSYGRTTGKIIGKITENSNPSLSENHFQKAMLNKPTQSVYATPKMNSFLENRMTKQ